MKLFGFKLSVLLLLAVAFTPGRILAQEQQPTAIVIVNAQVSDGSDAPLKKVSVRIAGDRVTKIGVFKPAKGEQVIDAQGLVLAPGFIDIPPIAGGIVCADLFSAAGYALARVSMRVCLRKVHVKIYLYLFN